MLYKTKHYELTRIEMIALRDSLDHYWHEVVKHQTADAVSPLRWEVIKSMRTLKDQLTDDVRLYRD